MRRLGGLPVALALLMTGPAAGTAGPPTFKELLSYVFFEDESAYLDPTNFICHHIVLGGDGDFCNVTFRVIDANSCKIEVDREIRATFDDGKGREFLLAKEIFTVANLDLERTAPETDKQKHTTRAIFEADIDIYRHEGYQYSFALDERGAYRACRIDGKETDISEAECVQAGTKAPSASKKMTLLFSEKGFARAMGAVRQLQHSYCPAGGNKL